MARKIHRATSLQADYGHGTLHVAVELAEEPGALLVMRTDRPHPKDWRTQVAVPVRPSDIAGWVRQALSVGWAPSVKGRQFLVRVVGSSVKKFA